MQAVNYYLVVDPIKDKNKKIGGLLISDTLDVDHRYSKGTIITKGHLVEGVNNGDVIHYDKHAGHQIHWKDNVYEVIKAPDIVLVE